MNAEEETKEPFIEVAGKTGEQTEESGGKTAPQSWKQQVRVNKDLLPMKLMYFFFFAGYSCTLPFLPVFFRYVGMSAEKTGIILGCQTIVKFLGSPFWGAVADKFRKHKLVMLITLAVSSSIVFGTAFIPPKRNKNSGEFQMNCCFVCQAKRNSDKLETSGPEGIPINIVSSSNGIMAAHVLNKSSLVDQVNPGTCNSHDSAALGLPSLSLDKNSSGLFTFNVTRFSSCQTILLDASNCELYSSLTLTKVKTEDGCNSTQITQLTICKNRNVKHKSLDDSRTFALLMGLILLASFFMVFESGIADASVVKYLIKIGRPRDYGKQRIWGGFGWGIFSVLAGMANDKVEESLQVNKYLASFSMYLALIFLTMLCVSKLHTSHLAASERPAILKTLASILPNFKVVSFLLVLLLNSIANGFIFMYLFIYLEELGANNLLMGITLAVSISAEIPLMYVSGFIIKKISHEGVFILTFMAFALRVFCYSVIPSAWYVLPVELLHGITFGMMWPAATSYVGIVAPHGMAATLQGLASGVYFYLGWVISGFVGGTMYAKYGAKKMYRTLSLLMLISGVLFALSNKLYEVLIEKKKTGKENVELNELKC